MHKGKKLTKNSIIGIIAPSSFEKTDIINKKINLFKSFGYKVKLGNHIFDRNSFFAGTAEDRANDIIDMFLDNSIDAILCLRGGYGSINTLPYIDKEIIINNPKIFCGYSDITILLNYFSSLGLITFHSPMINSNFNDFDTKKSFFNTLSYNKKNFTYNLKDYPSINYINATNFSGKIIGGNLSVICSSIGTPYQIDTTNSILLLEDINEYPYSIHRMLTQLLKSNLLNKCNALIIGYLSNHSNYIKSSDRDVLENVIIDVLKPLNIPIIMGFPFGHNYPNLTIPIGCNASFNIEKETLVLVDNFLN